MPTPRAGLDDFGFGRYLASGNVMFNDNQVVTDLTETRVSFAISSVLIVSLDDVTVQDNQLDCDFFLDFLFTNLLAVGMTLRINNNRLKETLFITLYSSVGLGLIFNNTSDNQATHCILSIHSPLDLLPFLNTGIVEQGNQELFHAITFLEGWCERLDQLGNILVRGQVRSAGDNARHRRRVQQQFRLHGGPKELEHHGQERNKAGKTGLSARRAGADRGAHGKQPAARRCAARRRAWTD